MRSQYVLCKKDKTPLQGAWQHRYPSPTDIDYHQGLVGLVPGSINCLVIDIDKFTEDGLEKIKKEFGNSIIVKSPKGYHLWISIQESRPVVGNYKWEAYGCSGDIRCDKGYVIMWERERVIKWRKQWVHHTAAANVLDRLGITIEGSRNIDLNHAVFMAARRGDDEAVAEAIERATLAGLSEKEARATAESAIKGAEKAGTSIDRNANGLEFMLNELDIRVRFNTRSLTNQIKYEDLPWINVTDRILAHVQDTMAKRFVYATQAAFKPMRWSAELWRIAYNALLYKYESDPFRDYLDALPGWDGVERIDELLISMFGVEDTALNRWASGFIFRGAVQRTYAPGAKLDVMPVFIGEQGIGKSSFLREILPTEHPEWFSDALNLSSDVKTRAETLQGRVIVEVGEMIGATRAELESLKTFLSRTDDGNVRLAYRHNPETMLRRCIIVGTTNDEQCLPNDPTGLRRFLPVTFKHGCNVESTLDPLREQLWAEAVEWYVHSKGNAALPHELMNSARVVTERARRADEVLEDKLESIASSLDEGELFDLDITSGLGLNDIALAAGLIPHGSMLDRRNAMRLSAALKTRGWYKKRVSVNCKPINKWYPSYATAKIGV